MHGLPTQRPQGCEHSRAPAELNIDVGRTALPWHAGVEHDPLVQPGRVEHDIAIGLSFTVDRRSGRWSGLASGQQQSDADEPAQDYARYLRAAFRSNCLGGVTLLPRGYDSSDAYVSPCARSANTLVAQVAAPRCAASAPRVQAARADGHCAQPVGVGLEFANEPFALRGHLARSEIWLHPAKPLVGRR